MVIRGTVAHYVFYAAESGYSVIKLDTGATVVGTLPQIPKGSHAEFTGEWTENPKFGKQFKAVSHSIREPKTKNAILTYLKSGIIRGVGEVYAERIVNTFGNNTIKILDKHPERLEEVPGLGKKKVSEIIESWQAHREERASVIELQEIGVPLTIALRVQRMYGGASAERIRSNPYFLVSEVWGVGFRTADEIAFKLGFQPDDPLRIETCVLVILQKQAEQGNVFLPKETLLAEVNKELHLEFEVNADCLRSLAGQGKVVIKEESIYFAPLYYAERAIEKKLRSMLATPPSKARVEAAASIPPEFSLEQRDAVMKVMQNRVMILTGGPGTGKTTAIKGILSLFSHLKRNIALAAPTGRAAKRMTEVIGIEAKTIHRLLEYNPIEESFGRDRNNLLEADVIVLDEMSMVNTYLAAQFLDAVPDNTTLLFVGDDDQLPCIGPGNILRDMIQSSEIPVVTLSTVFRQAAQSQIIQTAHTIKHGEFPELDYKKGSDFVFMECANDEQIAETIVDLVSNRLTKLHDPFKSIQVLTPKYKGSAGADALNQRIQEAVNTNTVLLQFKSKSYRTGDRVMQLRNNYEKEVFNGDIGFVHHYEKEARTVWVDFQGKLVKYTLEELDDLTLAYAITVHKSQGSEFPCVVIVLSNSDFFMMQRNLIYTGITRAAELLVIVGMREALATGIRNNRPKERFTSLFKHA